MMVIVEDQSRGWRDAESLSDDRSTFAAAVTPVLAAMYRLARRLAPAANADDIVQEALVRAWRHRRSFDPNRGSYRTWLFAIVANEARRRRSSFWGIPTDVRNLSSPDSSEDSLDLAAALRQLSPRQRLAVDCFYYAGLTVNETAEVMRCSPGTVKSTLSDARTKLRKILEAH